MQCFRLNFVRDEDKQCVKRFVVQKAFQNDHV